MTLTGGAQRLKRKGRRRRPVVVEPEFAVNEKIRSPKVLVVDDEKTKIGLMLTRDALALAKEKGLDLVEVSPNSDPPVARIMDYGKFAYMQQKRNRDSKKKQAQTQLKEIKLRTKTEEHDLQTKLKKAKEFLTKGDRVKVHVVYRGREMAHPELGRTMMERVIKELEEIGAPMDRATMQGRALITVIAPSSMKSSSDKPKVDIKQEQKPEKT
jgi:translation initiation factor IF-3